TCAPYVFSGCCGFLFQAEDGIRDFRVTGVQTCALPIYRLMFPIHDSRGRCIGFGGRVLKDDTPKYLNSPETVLFHKGRELYGLRSEERRVGKESKCRTSPGQAEKKKTGNGWTPTALQAK